MLRLIPIRSRFRTGPCPPFQRFKSYVIAETATNSTTIILSFDVQQHDSPSSPMDSPIHGRTALLRPRPIWRNYQPHTTDACTQNEVQLLQHVDIKLLHMMYALRSNGRIIIQLRTIRRTTHGLTSESLQTSWLALAHRRMPKN